MIEGLVVGDVYSRSDLDQILQTDRISGSREGLVYFAEKRAALLFVTLIKSGRSDAVRYNDWFEGDLFHWDSQNTQHMRTPRISDMVTGRLEPHLLVRVTERSGGRTHPFVYAGRLRYETHEAGTSNPVHIVWASVDYQDAPNAELHAVYGWTPAVLGAVSSRHTIGRPSSRGRRGQGYMQDPVARKAIELRAMSVAQRWYQKEGYDVLDTSANHAWDLECRVEAGSPLRVEVKGTVSGPETVFLTANEVVAAQRDGVPTELFIVHRIELELTNAGPVARGGVAARLENWVPEALHLRATEYSYDVPVHRLLPVAG